MLVPKGQELQYEENLKFVRSTDLSSNKLSGSIPVEISVLSELRFLNLSRNHLMGNIPKNIGIMKELKSINLSQNHLSGEIPSSMSNLSFLNYLDLSYNDFSGRIPSSTQLQSFDAVRYFGNCVVLLFQKDAYHQLENLIIEHQLAKQKKTMKVLASIWVWVLDSQLAFGEFVEVSS